MRRAGFGVRLGAGAMDAVFMYLLQFAAGMCVIPLFVVSQRNGSPGAGSEGIFKVVLALNAVVWTGYTLTEVFGAASPAKRLLKLRIASAAGGEAARSRKVVRWAIKYSPMFAYLVATAVMFLVVTPRYATSRPVSLAVLVAPQMVAGVVTLVVLGGFFATLGSGRQALHDMVVGTVVLRPGEEPQGFAPIMEAPIAPADERADR